MCSHFLYNHIAIAYVSWVSNYLPFSCGGQYVYNKCDVDVQLQQVHECVCDLLDRADPL